MKKEKFNTWEAMYSYLRESGDLFMLNEIFGVFKFFTIGGIIEDAI